MSDTRKLSIKQELVILAENLLKRNRISAAYIAIEASLRNSSQDGIPDLPTRWEIHASIRAAELILTLREICRNFKDDLTKAKAHLEKSALLLNQISSDKQGYSGLPMLSEKFTSFEFRLAVAMYKVLYLNGDYKAALKSADESLLVLTKFISTAYASENSDKKQMEIWMLFKFFVADAKWKLSLREPTLASHSIQDLHVIAEDISHVDRFSACGVYLNKIQRSISYLSMLSHVASDLSKITAPIPSYESIFKDLKIVNSILRDEFVDSNGDVSVALMNALSVILEMSLLLKRGQIRDLSVSFSRLQAAYEKVSKFHLNISTKSLVNWVWLKSRAFKVFYRTFCALLLMHSASTVVVAHKLSSLETTQIRQVVDHIRDDRINLRRSKAKFPGLNFRESRCLWIFLFEISSRVRLMTCRLHECVPYINALVQIITQHQHDYEKSSFNLYLDQKHCHWKNHDSDFHLEDGHYVSRFLLLRAQFLSLGRFDNNLVLDAFRQVLSLSKRNTIIGNDAGLIANAQLQLLTGENYSLENIISYEFIGANIECVKIAGESMVLAIEGRSLPSKELLFQVLKRFDDQYHVNDQLRCNLEALLGGILLGFDGNVDAALALLKECKKRAVQCDDMVTIVRADILLQTSYAKRGDTDEEKRLRDEMESDMEELKKRQRLG